MIEQLHESLKVKQTMIEVLTEENEQNQQASSLQEVLNEEVKKNKVSIFHLQRINCLRS